MHYVLPRVSHWKWRSFLKSERRRRKRKHLASVREQEIEREKASLMSNPTYRAWIEEQEQVSEEAFRLESELTLRKWKEWRLKDLELHKLFLKNKEKREKLFAEKQLREERIKQEWEEKVMKEEIEKEKKKREQEALLVEATCQLGKDEATHNPVAPPALNRGILRRLEPCPFFIKTGACRFGAECSREHDYPPVSRTLLLPNMYSLFCLDSEARDDYDMDLSLEFSELERRTHFRDFYCDVLPEFEKYGCVIQFKVCCNRSPHLRGNVYVQYEDESSALLALGVFNGRWYAGKQISCMFVPVERWKPAICGLYWSHRCPKGSACNFLHVYRNPGNAFAKADKDLITSSRVQHSEDHSYRREKILSQENKSQTTKSLRRERNTKSRSRERDKNFRSRERDKKNSRSRERDKKNSKSQERDKNSMSRERDNSRSLERDKKNSKSRERDKNSMSRERDNSRSRERDKKNSKSRERNNSRSREKNNSRSRERDKKNSKSREYGKIN